MLFTDFRYFLIGFRAWLAGRRRLRLREALEEIGPTAVHAQAQKAAWASVLLAGLALALVTTAQHGMAGEALFALVGLAVLGLFVAARRGMARWCGFYAEMVELGKAEAASAAAPDPK
jgi:hypothetical protein